jgi:hypothetical protein
MDGWMDWSKDRSDRPIVRLWRRWLSVDVGSSRYMNKSATPTHTTNPHNQPTHQTHHTTHTTHHHNTTGMDIFGKRFPKRTFDVGIAEQHAVTFAAGMAIEGLKPFCCIYSTFMQRGYDQAGGWVDVDGWMGGCVMC